MVNIILKETIHRIKRKELLEEEKKNRRRIKPIVYNNLQKNTSVMHTNIYI